MKKVISNFHSLRVSEQLHYLRHVVNSLKNNKAFAEVHPAPDELSTVAEEMEVSQGEVARLKAALMMENSKLRSIRKSAASVLRGQVESVNFLAQGDEETLRSSGLQLTETNTNLSISLSKLTKVQRLTVKRNDDDGVVELDWDRVKSAASYVIEITEDPKDDASWKVFNFCTATRFLGHITLPKSPDGSLLPHECYFRVAAIGKLGRGPYSSPVSKRLV